jgi:hypothetical protein
MSETVTITTEIYNDLLESWHQLQHLKAIGVDNWEGYSSWKKQLNDDEEDDDET